MGIEIPLIVPKPCPDCVYEMGDEISAHATCPIGAASGTLQKDIWGAYGGDLLGEGGIHIRVTISFCAGEYPNENAAGIDIWEWWRDEWPYEGGNCGSDDCYGAGCLCAAGVTSAGCSYSINF